MKTTSSGIKLIVFMVVTSFLTLVLAATIGNFGSGKATTYHARFSDVTGLLPGNEVRIAGVKVGKITAVELDGRHVRVEFKVDDSTRLGSETSASVRTFNVSPWAASAVELSPVSAFGAAPQPATARDTRADTRRARGVIGESLSNSRAN